jgi:hypothetical protein
MINLSHSMVPIATADWRCPGFWALNTISGLPWPWRSFGCHDAPEDGLGSICSPFLLLLYPSHVGLCRPLPPSPRRGFPLDNPPSVCSLLWGALPLGFSPLGLHQFLLLSFLGPSLQPTGVLWFLLSQTQSLLGAPTISCPEPFLWAHL